MQINKLSSHDMAYGFRRNCQKSGADNERLMRNRRLGQRRNTAEAKGSGHGHGIGGRCKGGYRWGKCRYNKIRPTLDRGSANSRRDRSKTNARGCQARGLSIELAKRQRRTRAGTPPSVAAIGKLVAKLVAGVEGRFEVCSAASACLTAFTEEARKAGYG